jgi:5-methylcytosine-specific restriction protein A
MPWSPRQPCTFPGCAERQLGSRCALHRRSQWSRNHRGVSRQARGLGGDWPRTRRRILERDGYTCQMRGPRCRVVATTVNHRIPRESGGTGDDSNLEAACATCNYGRVPSAAR